MNEWYTKIDKYGDKLVSFDKVAWFYNINEAYDFHYPRDELEARQKALAALRKVNEAKS